MRRSWLLDVSVGPVTRFIAAGRRSRDLWWGSTWLSECVRRTAEGLLAADGGEIEVDLLVPSRRRVEEVGARSATEPLTYGGRVSNRMRLLVTAAGVEGVVELAALAEQRAREALVGLIRESVRLDNPRRLLDADPAKLAAQTRRIRSWLEVTLDENAFRAQLEAIRHGDFLEVFAAWTPFDGAGFSGAFERADSLLGARKTARLFAAPSWTRAGLRKSDLDAGRDSVLVTTTSWPAPRGGERFKARRRLGIGPDEGLDALGIARRIAAFTCGPMLEPLPFPPLSRVAADAWLEAAHAKSATRPVLEELKGKLARALDERHRAADLFFTWCSLATDPGAKPGPHWREGLFPYDASLLFEGGYEAQWAEIDRLDRGRGDEAVQTALRDLAGLRDALERLHGKLGYPEPYYGLLEMDGDGVGAALASARDRDQLDVLVASLDRFADRAEELIRRRHGCAFYVGGDELAAYLPADTALTAARELADLFAREAAPGFAGVGLQVPTLSGGLALAHVRADLRAVRRQASAALRSAKRHRLDARNGDDERSGWLEVRDLPRSGSPRACRGPLAALVSRIDRWRRSLAEETLSLRSAHELAGLARRLRSDDEDEGGSIGIELAPFRVLSQQQRSSLVAEPELPDRLSAVTTWNEVNDVVAELLVARRVHRTGAVRPAGSQAVAPGEVAT